MPIGSPQAVRVINPFDETAAGTFSQPFEIDMRLYVTSGAGTTASPYAGWETIVPVANTTYKFGPGTWAFTTWPNFALSGVRVLGSSVFGTVLKHLGIGNALNFTGVASPLAYGIEVSELTVDGTATTTNALYFERVHHLRLINVRAKCASEAGLYLKGVVGPYIESFKCTVNEPGGFTVTPVNGIVMQSLNSSFPYQPTTVVTLDHPIIEGVSGSGILVQRVHDLRIFGCVSEANGRGIEFAPYDLVAGVPTVNYVNGNFEGNTIEGVLIQSLKNTFDNCQLGTLRISGAAANDNIISGGAVTDVTIEGGAVRNSLRDLNISGVLTDNGVDTQYSRVLDEVAGKFLPQTLGGRVIATGSVPVLSGATGLDTGSAAIVTTSTDYVGVVNLFPAGAPSNTGEFVITLNVPMTGANPPAIFATLQNGSPGNWDKDATVTVRDVGLTSFKLVWSNNGVALTAPGATYRVAYQIVGMR